MNLTVRLIGTITLMAIAPCLPHLAAQSTRSDNSGLEQRVKSYEQACVLSLRTINTAQLTYRGGDETKGFAHTLKELGPQGARILDSVISSGKKGGYRFRLTPGRATPSKAVQHYIVIAQPLNRLVKNQQSFFTDETGVIRFTTENRPATSADAIVDSLSQ